MDPSLLSIGYGNFLISKRVIAVISPFSAPVRRLREDAREEKRLIDATQGRKTRSIIITDSNHVIMSAVNSDTIAERFSPEGVIKGEDFM